MVTRRKKLLLFGALIGLVLVGAWLLTVGLPAPAGARHRMPAPSAIPADVARLLEEMTPQAREAYAFALERSDVLQYVACYCGCGNGGHASNLSCFVRPVEGGGITLEPHGAT